MALTPLATRVSPLAALVLRRQSERIGTLEQEVARLQDRIDAEPVRPIRRQPES